MITKRKASGKAGSIPKGLAIGAVVALLLTLLSVAGMTQLILGEKISVGSIGYGAMITLPIASATAACVTVRIVQRRRMQMCLLSGLVYFVLLGILNVMFFGGQFEGVGVSLLLIFLGAVCVGLIGLKGEKGSRKKRKAYRPC